MRVIGWLLLLFALATGVGSVILALVFGDLLFWVLALSNFTQGATIGLTLWRIR